MPARSPDCFVPQRISVDDTGTCHHGLVAMYIAKSYTLIETIMQNSIMFWGLLIAEVGLVMYLSAVYTKSVSPRLPFCSSPIRY